jgi:hypothetical protein
MSERSGVPLAQALNSLKGSLHLREQAPSSDFAREPMCLHSPRKGLRVQEDDMEAVVEGGDDCWADWL